MRIIDRTVVYLLLVACLLWLGGWTARPAAANGDALDAYIRTQLTAQRIPGLSLAIAWPDGRMEVRSYGHDGRGEPVSPQTQFGFPLAYAEPPDIFTPSGSVILSGADMAALLFLFASQEPSVISQASRAAMLTPPPEVDSDYGMGWFEATLNDGTAVLTHGGDLHTFHADMVLLPDEGVAFALLPPLIPLAVLLLLPRLIFP